MKHAVKTQLRYKAAQSPQSQLKPTDWAAFSADEALSAFGTEHAGLADEEAAKRLQHEGPNSLPRIARPPWYVEFATNFIHLFALLLWVGAALAWIAGMPQLSFAIMAVIAINGCFSYWQEYQAERAMEAFEALLPREVTVRRSGRELLIAANNVVRGDLLVLSEGQSIPADARVVLAERLRVDTSSLTGESRPVARYAARAAATGSVATFPNLVFAGTSIASGRGEAVVFGTGAATEFGRIARLTQRQRERPSPLQRELQRVTRTVTVIAVASGLIFFFIGSSLGGLSKVGAFLFAVAIIVANVPEGLLPTLTLALALGVRRMARSNALVKRLSAVETLGATTIILTDKTGTLTENEMAACEVWAGGLVYPLAQADSDAATAKEGSAEAVIELLRTAALCCDAHLLPLKESRRRWRAIGDPTEAAILVAAARVGLSADSLSASLRLGELPFDSIRKRMTTIQKIDGGAVACVKGAPSEVFPRCAVVRWSGPDLPFDQTRRQMVEEAQHAMAGRGLRVLAIALRKVPFEILEGDGWKPEEVEKDLTLLGLVAMEDPPRPEVPKAVAACHRAGIRVVMVTGDDGLTASTIAREIGLYRNTPRVITGAELDALDEQATIGLFDAEDLIFARVLPEHKLRLVEACQRRGEVVAVTGDGVNDAPALKRANIGVAMGETGTDVAREAADMVLVDDNFGSIVAAIEEGRAVYDNVRKFVTYIFSSNVPEVVPFIAFVLFRIPLPLTVMQILAVDLGTDLLPALALGAEAPEPGVMSRPPRSRDERLLTLPTLLHAYGWLGIIEASLSLAGFFFAFWLAGWRPGMPLTESGQVYISATTMSLAGIVACQVGNALACRSSTRSIWHLGVKTNRLLLGGIAVELALLILLIYAPPFQAAFGLSPLGLEHWMLLVLFGPMLLLLEEGRKAIRKRRGEKMGRGAP